MTYDAPRVYRELIEPQYAPIAAALLERVPLRASDDVLELGAGTGLLTEMVAPRVRSLVATDAVESMLDVARTRAPRATFETLNFTEPFPYDDETFDVVLACLTHAQHLTPTVAEIARVLRPGGRIGVAQWGTAYRESILLNRARRTLGLQLFGSAAPGRNEQRLRRAGFAVERTDVGFAPEYESVDAYIEYRRGFGRPTSWDEETYEAFLREVAREASRYADGGGRFVNRWNITILVGRLQRG
jgi:SAM-dependent methyltransferase